MSAAMLQYSVSARRLDANTFAPATELSRTLHRR
jgi:hypothetical protein